MQFLDPLDDSDRLSPEGEELVLLFRKLPRAQQLIALEYMRLQSKIENQGLHEDPQEEGGLPQPRRIRRGK